MSSQDEKQRQINAILADVERLRREMASDTLQVNAEHLGIPPELYDPITGGLLEDPVIAGDNRVYSREVIESWFQTCRGEDGKVSAHEMTRTRMLGTLTDRLSLCGRDRSYRL